MVKVKILIEGYVKNDIFVVPTTTLIQDSKTNIVVDPGMGKDKPKALAKALKKENLTFSDINIVFATHYHLDHTQYAGLFSNAKLIDYKYIYDGEKWTDHKGKGYKISPHVSIIHTPGHTTEHASLRVNTSKGVIVVAGDVWWFSDMTPEVDDMAVDQKRLEESRKKLLGIADWIIPGHGKMFKNPKQD